MNTEAANVRERRKALNAVLYTLLEIRWEVMASNPATILAVLKELLTERFGPQADQEFAKPEIRDFFRQLIAAAVPADREGLAERYVQSVQTLAPFYPLIAHRLTGAQITAFDQKMHEHYDRLRAHPVLAADPNVPLAIGQLEDHTLETAFAHAKQSLTDSIDLIRRCYKSPMRWRIKAVLRRQDQQASADQFVSFFKKNLGSLISGSR
jgi:hypothetical protein